MALYAEEHDQLRASVRGLLGTARRRDEPGHDPVLWRRMCGQHIERKCEKCGWGLPALERRRLKVELGQGSPAVAVGVGKHTHDAT